MKPISLLLAVILLTGCGKQSSETQSEVGNSEVREEVVQKVTTPNLILVRYGNLPTGLMDETKSMLSSYFGEITVMEAALPDSAYYQPRGRYLSKILLNQLLHFRESNTLVLGITEKDISTAVHGYDNYGIMGQASLNQKVAVVSTWRLGKVNHLQKQDFKKLMLHELAHSVGLRHCKTDDCILHDAEKKNRFSQSPSFCVACKQQLTARGWKNLN
jgi:archaemetzincin